MLPSSLKPRRLVDRLRPLAVAPSQFFIADDVQVVDLLKWILDQSGPARVRISSFSIADEFLRRLYILRKRSSLITSIQIVLDFKATHKTLSLWPFIRQTVERCYLANNHSKVVLVDNDAFQAVVITSQNLTRGNRFEAAAISTDPAAFAAMSADFDEIVNTKSIPFDEVFSGSTHDN